MEDFSLEELKVMAGCDIKQVEVKLTNVPKVENQIPEPTIENFIFRGIHSVDHNIENAANRLNSLLGHFAEDIKIERLN